MLNAWWTATAEERRRAPSPIEQAIAMGRCADRLGLAFFGGYTAALRVIDPTLGPDDIAALCATEAGGGHPRAIATTLEAGVLSGSKYFVSGGSLATRLLVVARTGEQGGRPTLVVARVEAETPGVTIEDLPPLPFVPEVPHASVSFREVRVSATLEGDGYARVLKPFRTIEDLHVFAAIVSCVLANGPLLAQSVAERLEAVLAALRNLASRAADDAEVHLALAGTLSVAREALEGLDRSTFTVEFFERFDRDRPLLRIAEKAREQRRQKAWEMRGSRRSVSRG